MIKFTIIQSIPNVETVRNNTIHPEDIKECSWDSFVNMIQNTQFEGIDKSAFPMIIPADFKTEDFEPNKHGKIRRCKANIKKWHMLPVDVDDGMSITEAQELFADYEYVLYTTHSHSNLKDKFRLFIPLLEPVKPKDFESRRKALSEFLRGADTASISSSQGFYAPSNHPNNKDLVVKVHNKGKRFDLLALQETKKPTKKLIHTDCAVNDTARQLLANHVIKHKSGSLGYLERIKLASALKCAGFDRTEVIQIVDTCSQYDHSQSNEHVYTQAKHYFDGAGFLITLFDEWGIKSDFDFNAYNSELNDLPPVFEAPQTPSDDVLIELKTSVEVYNRDTFEFSQRDQKLSEVLSEDDFIEGINLLDSPTNSGKTYFFANACKSKRIIAAPTKVLIDQICADTGITKVYGQKQLKLNTDVIACTYDKLEQLLSDPELTSEYDLYIDEAHNMYASYGYRKKSMSNVLEAALNGRFKRVVLMSGTFNRDLCPSIKVDKSIKVVRDSQTPKVCKVIHSTNTVQTAINLILDSERCILLYNNKTRAHALSTTLSELGIKSLVMTKDTKDEKEIQNVLASAVIPDDVRVLIITQIGVEGISITNTDIDKIISLGQRHVGEIEQLKNRARRSNPEVVVIRSDNEGSGLTKPINPSWYIKKAQYFADGHNDVLINDVDLDVREKRQKYIQNTLKYSDSSYTHSVKFNAGLFDVSPLGIAHLMYQREAQNQFNSYDYFTDAMRTYGFEVEVQIDDPDETATVDTEAAEHVMQEKREKQWNDLHECRYFDDRDFLVQMDDEAISFVYEPHRELIQMFSYMARIYPIDELKRIYINGDTQSAQDVQGVMNGSLIRHEITQLFKVGEVYSPDKKNDLVRELAETLHNEHHMDIRLKLQSPKASTRYLQKFIKIKKKKVQVQGVREWYYAVESHVPGDYTPDFKYVKSQADGQAIIDGLARLMNKQAAQTTYTN